MPHVLRRIPSLVPHIRSEPLPNPASSLWRAIWVLLLVLLLATSAGGLQKKKRAGKEEATVNGTVMDQEGQLLNGAAVALSSADDGGFETQAVTDKKGQFRITVPSPSGEYRIKLSADGYASFEDKLDLGPREEYNVEFRLVDQATGQRAKAVSAYNDGAKLFNREKREQAKEKFLLALELKPDLPEPHLPLAEIYLDEGEVEKAAHHAERALELRPGDQNAQILAYTTQRKMGNEARVEELRQVLAQSPKLAAKLAIQVFNEGAVASQDGDFETAIDKFRTALDFDPNLIQAHAALASMYYSSEAFAEALQAVEKLMALDPQNLQGRRYRYLIHDARNEQARAAEAFEAYREVDAAGAADTLYKRAELDFRSGLVKSAIEALGKVLEIKPDMPQAHYTLGLCYATSDKTKARHHLERFMELAPDDPEVSSVKEMLSYL